MKAVFLAFSWILLSSGVILTGIAGLQFFNLAEAIKQTEETPSNVLISSSLDESMRIDGASAANMAAIMEAGDARAQIIANFLERHNSPLKPYDYYGEFLVETADKYGLDFRFLPAIMMEESNLCRVTPKIRTNPDDPDSGLAETYNCLGLGVHSRGTWGFKSYEENLEKAAEILKKNYIDQGRLTTYQVAQKYTASVDKWTNSVNQWMAEMRYDDRVLGRSMKENTDVTEFTGSSATPAATLSPETDLVPLDSLE